MKVEDKIEYFLKDHFKIKLHITILTIFLFFVTLVNIFMQIFDGHTSPNNIYIKIEDLTFIDVFFKMCSFMIKPLSDTYYFTYYIKYDAFKNLYWFSLFSCFIYSAFSFYFYENIKYEKSKEIDYNKRVKICNFYNYFFFASILAIGISSYIYSSPHMYFIFMFIMTYLEVNIVMLLIFRYLRSFIFMIFGAFFYFFIFREDIIVFNRGGGYQWDIIKDYKNIVIFYMLTTLIFLRFKISDYLKFYSTKDARRFLKRHYLILYYVIKIKDFKKWKSRYSNIAYKIYNNIIIIASTYIVVVSVWGFFNKTGGFLISSLFHLVL